MKHSKYSFQKELITYALLPIAIVFMLQNYFSLLTYGVVGYCTTSGFALSVIIMYCIFLVAYAITKKTWKSITFLSVLSFIFSIINMIKVLYTDEPIFFSDIMYLNSSGELINIINGTFWNTIKEILPATLIYLILLIIACIIAYKYNIDIKEKKYRIMTGIIPIIVLVILFVPINFTNKIFLNVFIQVNKREDYDANTNNLIYYIRYGVISGMYGQMLENRIVEPENYNEEEIENYLKNAKGEEEKKLGKPNIIVVFSESFWDIDQLDEVEFNTKVTKNFNKLKEKGLFFDMISPSYGGISANVEFEFLTGANTAFFNNGYVPYMQLYRNKSYYNKPSIIAELKNNGYKTQITTPVSEKLFSCGKFYKYLGVDKTEFLTDVDESEIKGKYMSDESITNRIIEKFNSKEKEEKLFYMVLTMQGHMPYTIEKYNTYDVKVQKSNLTQEMNETLTSYAQGIYDADKQLGRLYEYIKTLDEPTILVFYGDHLPYFQTKDGDDVMKSLEYFNTEDKLLNTYRKYNTQSLILANFDLKESKEKEKIKYLGVDMLSAYILNNMDIEISGYYKWLYEVKDVISASNHFVSVDQYGNLYSTNKLYDDMKKMYDLRECVQYKYFVK